MSLLSLQNFFYELQVEADSLQPLFHARMITLYGLYACDFIDTYLHDYPHPKQTEIEAIKTQGAFAKYEGLCGRLCWMILSYTTWFLLLQKNYFLAKQNMHFANCELFLIALSFFGWGLRQWCKKIMNKRYTYDITIYKNHRICNKGPYSLIVK